MWLDYSGLMTRGWPTAVFAVSPGRPELSSLATFRPTRASEVLRDGPIRLRSVLRIGPHSVKPTLLSSLDRHPVNKQETIINKII